MNINEPETMGLLGNVTWSVSNLCRGKPSPAEELIKPAIEPLAQLLKRNVSQDVTVDAVWALSYLADGDDDRIQMVMETGVAPSLIELLKQKHQPFLTPAVRTLGNFVTGTDTQTQAVVDAGVVASIVEAGLLENSNVSFVCCFNRTTTTLIMNCVLQQKNLLTSPCLAGISNLP